MLLATAIYRVLTENTAIAAVVSDRVHPLRAPKDVVAPFLVYQQISAQPWRAINGPSGISQVRMQVDAYATGYAAVRELALLVRGLLDGYRDQVGSIRIAGISLQNEIDFLEEDEKPMLYRVSMDFLITYEEE